MSCILVRRLAVAAALLTLAMADIAFTAQPDATRAELRSALEATAIPHWCDTAFLAALWFVAFICLIPFAELRTDGVFL